MDMIVLGDFIANFSGYLGMIVFVAMQCQCGIPVQAQVLMSNFFISDHDISTVQHVQPCAQYRDLTRFSFHIRDHSHDHHSGF